MIIYLDVLIIKEMIINYLIIYLTGKLSIVKASNILFASFIATLYTICCFIEPHLISPMCKILISMLVICISLKPESINDLIKKSITFYFVTFFVAGIFSYKKDITMQVIYLISAVVVGLRLLKNYREKHMLKNYFCFVELPKLNLKLKALIDTGHFLKGESGEEVIVVSSNVYTKLRGQGKEVLIKYKTIDKEVPVVHGINIKNIQLKYLNNLYKYDSATFIKSNSGFKDYDALVSMRFLNLEKESGKKNGNLIFN